MDHEIDDEAMRQLCARLFADPSRLVQCACIHLVRGLEGPAHAHTDLLQLDLALDCEGQWQVDGVPVAARDMTAVAFYPGQTHSYALRAGSSRSWVFSLKLRVDRRWPAVRRRIFPPVLRYATRQPLFTERLRQIAGFVAAPRTPPAVLASLTTALCAWPVQHVAQGVDASAAGPAGISDDAVDCAVRMIEQRLTDPPSLAELGAGAHVSSRQLVRRFQAVLHCTPHAYAAACRVERARALLLEGRANVTEVADALGFTTVASFSRWFTQQTGTTPSIYRHHPARL